MSTAPAIVERFARLDSGCISDAMDVLGIAGCLPGIRPLTRGTILCGTAFTVRYAPCGNREGTVGDYLDLVSAGSVIVIDNRGRLDCSVWGDLLSLAAQRCGINGTVIDGVCRDVPGIERAGYRVFSRGAYMATGKDRVRLESVRHPVHIAGVRVEPFDVMFGDDTGVVRIPRGNVLEVLTRAEGIRAAEMAIDENVRQGMSLVDARRHFGYHSLQSHLAGTTANEH